ncbi:MAG: 2-amino-4-hydroxy-6-hydroxymethyldihydropteridine diphosphokinase [Gammaproteobacteria bacterium]|jgi:2-amino-4-hydroxy-6-hydroxymethyldihydropteridine diphosphokinase
MTVRAYIGIGSNLNDPAARVQAAFGALQRLPDTRLAARSSLYRSKPMGPANQPDYVNAVAALDTRMPAAELLQALARIEDREGRERGGIHWGPRILDLDLLLYGSQCIATPTLTVPHPGMHERDFVLVPLAEIAGDLDIPGHGPLSTLTSCCGQHDLVRLVTAS